MKVKVQGVGVVKVDKFKYLGVNRVEGGQQQEDLQENTETCYYV